MYHKLHRSVFSVALSGLYYITSYAPGAYAPGQMLSALRACRTGPVATGGPSVQRLGRNGLAITAS